MKIAVYIACWLAVELTSLWLFWDYWMWEIGLLRRTLTMVLPHGS